MTRKGANSSEADAAKEAGIEEAKVVTSNDVGDQTLTHAGPPPTTADTVERERQRTVGDDQAEMGRTLTDEATEAESET